MLNILVALIAAFPVGWGSGLVIAKLIAGSNASQLPAFTIPLCLIAALIFALVPFVPVVTRRNVLLAGAAGFIVLAAIFP
jgi:glucose uptake protein GlcU